MKSCRTDRRAQGGGPGQEPHEIERLVRKYGRSWLASARRHSAGTADADDAYQRGLEILLTKGPDLPDEELAAWTHTVIRNEALGIHRSRRREIDKELDEIGSEWASETSAPDEKFLNDEQLGQRREALRRITANQARCLLLRADGYGYPEICEITGFSYTKVNRYLSDGRRALKIHVGLIESGAECARLDPMLSLVADGEADPSVRREIDGHLANCLACRSTLREYMVAPNEVMAAFPLALLGARATDTTYSLAGRALERLDQLVAAILGRVNGFSSWFQSGVEGATLKKGALAVAATVSVVAGASVESFVDGTSEADSFAASVPGGSIHPLNNSTRDRRDARSSSLPVGRGAIRSAVEADLERISVSDTNPQNQSGDADDVIPAGDAFTPGPGPRETEPTDSDSRKEFADFAP